MFDAPFDVFAVMIAIAAFLIALKASNQASDLRRRLNALETAARTPSEPQPPALTPWPAFERTLATTAPSPPEQPPPLAPVSIGGGSP